MEKTHLENFIESIPDFDSFRKSHKILNFGFYLQTYENCEQFTAQDIEKCFDAFDYEKPANIKDLLNKLTTSGNLIPKNDGYRVEKQTADKIKKQISSNNSNRIEKVYIPGQMYEFYRDIQNITLSSKKEVFVIDAYASEDIIDLYLDKLPQGIKIMILTSKPQGNFLKVAQKFKLKHGNNFKVKSHKSCHDRLFFADKTCYVIGQSIEKAAKDQPTYLCQIENGGPFRSVFQSLFDGGKLLV